MGSDGSMARPAAYGTDLRQDRPAYLPFLTYPDPSLTYLTYLMNSISR